MPRRTTAPASTPISVMASVNSSPCISLALSETTTISLIDAMIPTTRKGSATSLRSRTVARTAPRSSTNPDPVLELRRVDEHEIRNAERRTVRHRSPSGRYSTQTIRRSWKTSA